MNSILKSTLLVLLVRVLAAAVPLSAAEGPFEQGMAHMKAGEYGEAIRIFSFCVELIPHDHEAHYQRGMAWMFKGDDDRAAADFSKAIEINPDYAPAIMNRGVVFSLKGDQARAIADFSRVLEIDPDNVEARCNRGAALCESGRCGRAVRDYAAALKLDPLSARLHGFKGFALERLGNFAGALVYYRKAIRLDPGDHASRNNLAWIMATCPDERYLNGAESVRMASEALAINHEPAYLDTLAAAYAEIGLFEEAVSTQEKFMAALADGADADDVAAHEERLALYRSGKSFRISPKARSMETLEGEGRIDPAPALPSPPAADEPEKRTRRPYTIQVESRREMEASLRIALGLRKKGLPSFTSVAHIPNKGVWRRVFVGAFASVPAARKELERVRLLGFPDAFVAKMPFTLRLTPEQPRASPSELENDLRSRGFLPPSPGSGRGGGAGEILVGAFETRAAARESAEDLREAGFHFEIAHR